MKRLRKIAGIILIVSGIIAVLIVPIEALIHPELTQAQLLIKYYPNILIGFTLFTFGIYLDTKK